MLARARISSAPRVQISYRPCGGRYSTFEEAVPDCGVGLADVARPVGWLDLAAEVRDLPLRTWLSSTYSGPHTSISSARCVINRPRLRTRTLSSSNSVGVRWISWPARATNWAARLDSQVADRQRLGLPAPAPTRRSAASSRPSARVGRTARRRSRLRPALEHLRRLVADRRQHQDRHLRPLAQHTRSTSMPSPSGHTEIDDRRVRRAQGRGVECLLARSSACGSKPASRADHLQRAQDLRLVVADEHPRRSLTPAGPAAALTARARRRRSCPAPGLPQRDALLFASTKPLAMATRQRRACPVTPVVPRQKVIEHAPLDGRRDARSLVDDPTTRRLPTTRARTDTGSPEKRRSIRFANTRSSWAGSARTERRSRCSANVNEPPPRSPALTSSAAACSSCRSRPVARLPRRCERSSSFSISSSRRVPADDDVRELFTVGLRQRRQSPRDRRDRWSAGRARSPAAARS